MESYDVTERRLLANDPTLQSIDLDDIDDVVNVGAAERVIGALSHSTHVGAMNLSFRLFDHLYTQLLNGEIVDVRGTMLECLTDWISNSASLETLGMVRSSQMDESAVRFLPIFLNAVCSRVRGGKPPLRGLVIDSIDVDADIVASLVEEAQLERGRSEFCTKFSAGQPINPIHKRQRHFLPFDSRGVAIQHPSRMPRT
jgi:hypothetical protein